MNGTAVTRKPGTDMTEPSADYKASRFLQAYGGQLEKLTPEKQAAFLMALGQHIGVRAELGEVIIYQGKPYICIDGRYRLAHNTGLLAGLEVRPATTMERRNYGVAENVALWVSNCYRRGAQRAFVGWGEAGGPTDKNPVSKDSPAKMAKKRARYDALRIAFPAGEEITPMHREYIEEAEALAKRSSVGDHALAAAAYDDDAEETVDEAALEVAVVTAPATKPGGPTEAQVARILALADHPTMSGMRDSIHANLAKQTLTEKTAASWIVALETGINGPRDADGATTGVGDGELPLGAPTRTVRTDALRDG